ncbi:MAG: hypothetical protein WC827_01960 [Candidatus Paceibacterota bacterium]|jgi:hypothetical protein
MILYIIKVLSMIGSVVILLFLTIGKKENLSYSTWGIFGVGIILVVIILCVFIRKYFPSFKIPRIRIKIFWNNTIKKILKWVIILGSVILVWWFWHPIWDSYIPWIMERKPGYVKCVGIQQGANLVKPTKEVRQKVWRLRWERPEGITSGYPHIPGGTFKVHFITREDSSIEFDLSNDDQIPEKGARYKLGPVTGSRECYGTFNGEKLYALTDESELWRWSGSYKNRRSGGTGKVFLNKRQKGNEVEYFGKVSLEPQYKCNKMISFVIFQE